MYRYLFVLTATAVTLFSCQTPGSIDSEDGLAAFSADSLGNHIKMLSSDSFMGRKPFTEGETKAINYLRNEFIASGLEPGNGDSYFQDVPMVQITTKASPEMKVEGTSQKFTLKGFDDYVI